MAAFRLIAVCFFSLLFALPIASPSRADDVSGDINGYVYSENASGDHRTHMQRATVLLYSWDNSAPVGRRVSDDSGFFSFLGVLSGRYYVVARVAGYRPDCWQRVVIIPGSSRRINVYMMSDRVSIDCFFYPEWGDEGIMF